ncbi:MAG: CatB-related O-acetyltransferase [Thermodesulfovibrionales bacterium]
MNIKLLLVNVLAHIREHLVPPVRITRLSKRYPSCRFYPGAVIDEASSLGGFNVLFRNVSVLESTISDHTFIQKNSVINNATIGKFCSIAAGVTIGLGQHPTSYVSSHPAFYSCTQPIVKTFCNEDIFCALKRTVIGHDVWIGQNALIMDGVTIGTGAVIAAAAVVTKDVPEYAIVAGVAAKVIGYRFDENIRDRLLATKWWDMSDDWLREHYSSFSAPQEFLGLFNKETGNEDQSHT